MSEKYKFRDPEGIYFVSPTVTDWIDLFTRKELRHILIDSLRYCQEHKGLIIHSWVIMPSHLHLIVSSPSGLLSDVLRDFKKHTSKLLIKTIEEVPESRREWLLAAFSKAGKGLKRVKAYKVWKDGNQPKLLDSNHLIQQKLDYLHQNPVEAELVDEPEHYRYSSARDYAGQPGLLTVDLLD